MKLETRMTFSTIGIDHSLDFVKGFAIICVLLNHCVADDVRQRMLFHVWGLPAVPFFLLIQTFHAYKRGLGNESLNLHKLWTRVARPFLLVELLILLFLVVEDPWVPLAERLKFFAYHGGAGTGAYYPWVYMQFAVILPLLKPLLRRVHGVRLALVFVAVSVGAEVLCCMANVPEWVYWLLCVRYVFLIYLGYILVVEGAVLNVLTLSLSAVSLAFVFWFEYADPRLEPLFYGANNWRDFHWICYFHVAFPLLYLLAKYFYWLWPGSWLERVMCSLGHHSFAIFIFQLFYFAAVAPYVRQLLGYIGNENVEALLYTLLALVSCTLPVIHFVSGKKDMVVLTRVLAMMLVAGVVVAVMMWRWRPYYSTAEPMAPYQVMSHTDDTLRVGMVGDSWVRYHVTLGRDSLLEQVLRRELGSDKVTLRAAGKGGATTGEIYDRLSAERALAYDYDLEYSFQPVIESGPDYCIISAGINEARQRRGKNYYVENYLLMIDFLLRAGIRPVIIELPDVEVDAAFDFKGMRFRLRSLFFMYYMRTSLHGTSDYRQALKDAMQSHQLMDSVVYVSYKQWNPGGWHDKPGLYVDDNYHLNLNGYAVLDSCLATEIVRDWRSRH